MVKGSHLVDSSLAAKMDVQDPVVPLGSCLLNDYRVSHRGMANRSDVVRPILTIIYNRPWFRDFKNYSKQPPLRCSLRAYQAMEEDHQRFFAWQWEGQPKESGRKSESG